MKYPEIVTKALNTEFLPFIKNIINNTMIIECGNDWYAKIGESIMKDYRFNEQLNIESTNPIANFDITAIIFLLFPYVEDENRDGLISVLKKHYNLSDTQINRLSYIRKIRNNCAHSVVTEEDGENPGKEEKGYLKSIYSTMTIFSKDIDSRKLYVKINKYIEELDKIIEKDTTDKDSKRLLMIKNEINSRREAYKKIYQFDCFEDEMMMPLKESVPWTKDFSIINELPWPVSNNDLREDLNAIASEVNVVNDESGNEKNSGNGNNSDFNGSNADSEEDKKESPDLKKAVMKFLFGKKQ